MTAGDVIVFGEQVTISVNGAPMVAHRGQTLAAALLANGVRTLRRTRRDGRPRGMFCAMGVCFDCVLTVDGKPGVRACMTPVDAGMTVTMPERFFGRRGA